MIKKTLLNILSRKSVNASSESVGFNHSTTVGIIAMHDATEANQHIVEQLEDLGKDVRIISFISNPVKTENYPRQTFTAKEVSMTGSILSDDVLYFIKQSYDFLLSFDDTGNRVIKYLASQTKAHHKVGLYHPKMEGILDMMIKPTTENPTQELFKYLTMIRHD